MRAISEQEFEQLCAGIADDARDLLMAELFRRVCRHVGLDPNMQRAELPGNYAFALARTLDDHMFPPFHHSEAVSKFLPPDFVGGTFAPNRSKHPS